MSITDNLESEVIEHELRADAIMRALRTHAARTLQEAAANKLVRVMQQVALHKPKDNYGAW